MFNWYNFLHSRQKESVYWLNWIHPGTCKTDVTINWKQTCFMNNYNLFWVCLYIFNRITNILQLFRWEKVRTTKITTSKTKKNIEKFGDDHYIEMCPLVDHYYYDITTTTKKRLLTLWFYLWHQKRSQRQKSKISF